MIKSKVSEIVYCFIDCALSNGEREEDLEQYTPESLAFTGQCPGCGDIV